MSSGRPEVESRRLEGVTVADAVRQYAKDNRIEFPVVPSTPRFFEQVDILGHSPSRDTIISLGRDDGRLTLMVGDNEIVDGRAEDLRMVEHTEDYSRFVAIFRGVHENILESAPHAIWVYYGSDTAILYDANFEQPLKQIHNLSDLNLLRASQDLNTLLFSGHFAGKTVFRVTDFRGQEKGGFSVKGSYEDLVAVGTTGDFSNVAWTGKKKGDTEHEYLFVNGRKILKAEKILDSKVNPDCSRTLAVVQSSSYNDFLLDGGRIYYVRGTIRDLVANDKATLAAVKIQYGSRMAIGWLRGGNRFETQPVISIERIRQEGNKIVANVTDSKGVRRELSIE